MAGDIKEVLKAVAVELKAAFFNQIMVNELSPLEAINASQFMRDGKKNPIIIDNTQLERVKETVKTVLVCKVWCLSSESHYQIGNNQLDYKRGIKFWGYDPTAKQWGITENDISNLQKISIDECIQITAVMMLGQQVLYEKMQELVIKHDVDVCSIEYIGIRNQIQIELMQLAVSAYVRPKIDALLQHNTQGLDGQIVFQKAAAVFAECESQLSSSSVSPEYKQTISNLIDGTVQGLAGNLDMKSYAAAIDKLPHERRGSRMLIGAACAFFGLLLIGAAVAAAFLTFGATTPISVLGITLGAKTILAGAAVAGGLGLGLGGFGTFFANTKPQPIEPAALGFSQCKQPVMGG